MYKKIKQYTQSMWKKNFKNTALKAGMFLVGLSVLFFTNLAPARASFFDQAKSYFSEGSQTFGNAAGQFGSRALNAWQKVGDGLGDATGVIVKNATQASDAFLGGIKNFGESVGGLGSQTINGYDAVLGKVKQGTDKVAEKVINILPKKTSVKVAAPKSATKNETVKTEAKENASAPAAAVEVKPLPEPSPVVQKEEKKKSSSAAPKEIIIYSNKANQESVQSLVASSAKASPASDNNYVTVDAATGVATLKGIKIIGTVDFTEADVKGFKQTVVNNYSSGGSTPLVVYNSTSGNYENRTSISGNYGGVSEQFSVGKDLTVGQNATVASALTIGSTSSNGSLTVNGTAAVTGATTLTGVATLSSDLTVNGNTTLGDVAGDTITINGRLSTLNISDGSTTSSLAKNSFYIAADSSNALGKFYVDSSGNVTASGTITSSGGITMSGHLTPSSDNLYDVGSSSTQWRYGNFQGGLLVANGSTTSTLLNNTFTLGQASDSNLGKFNVDSSGNVSASGSLKTFGNVTSTGNLYALSGAASTSILNGSSLTLGQGTSYGSGMFNVNSNGNVSASGTVIAGGGSITVPALSFNGDSNTGFSVSTADHIDFIVGGLRRAYLGETANLSGIGSEFNVNAVAPLSSNVALSLAGNITDAANAIAVKIGNITALSTAGAKIASFYSGAKNTTEKAYIDLNGGIGLAVTAGTFDNGKFNVDSSGNVSASGTLKSFATSTFVNDVIIGTNDTSLAVTGLVMNGNDLYIHDDIGINGTLYVDTGAQISGVLYSIDNQFDAWNSAISLKGWQTDGATAIGAKFIQGSPLTNATARLAVFYSGTQDEQAFILQDGSYNVAGGTAASASSTFGGSSISLNKTTGYNAGVFTVDSSGNVSASGSLKTYGNVTSTGNLYALSGTASTSILNGSSLQLGVGASTGYGSGMFNVDSNGNVNASGTIQTGAGAIALPAYSFVGDPNTGIYNSAANTIGFSADGQEKVVINTAHLKMLAIRRVATGQLSIEGAITDGTTAKGIQFGNENALVTAGSKIASFYNNALTQERAFIGWDGSFAAAVSSTNGYAGGQFFVDSSGNVSASGTLAFTNSSGGTVSSTAGALRFQGFNSSMVPTAPNPEFEFWNGGPQGAQFLTIGFYQGMGVASTTFTSYIPAAFIGNPGNAGFVLNTIVGTAASPGEMASTTGALDRVLLAVQNNGVNRFVVSPGGNVYADESFIANSESYGIADMAEYINLTTGETGEPGDVLVVDLSNPNKYKKSSSAYTKEIAGVISDTGAFLMGASGEGRAPLALAGLVKTKVTDENGPIAVGDYLVSASKPGYAMRYDENSGKSAGLVGMALEPLAEGDGKITIMINKGLVAGGGGTPSLTVGENSDGTLSGGENWDLGGKSVLNVKSISGANGLWYIDEMGLLVAKEIKADKVQAKKFVVEKESDLKKASVGEATITNSNSSVAVENELITPKVKIFITFRSNPNSFWWISSQIDGKFEVSLSKAAEGDLTFDYWIVGIEEAPALEPEVVPAAAVAPVDPAVVTVVEPAPIAPAATVVPEAPSAPESVTGASDITPPAPEVIVPVEESTQEVVAPIVAPAEVAPVSSNEVLNP